MAGEGRLGRGLTGPLVRAVGGVPIDRSGRHGMVEQMIEQMARREDFHLVIPPEGTRSRADYWKSGFYRIALGAGVPVVPGVLDYRNRTGGFGPPIAMTGDVHVDMQNIRDFYGPDAPELARYPEKFGPIRLREEDEAGVVPTPR